MSETQGSSGERVSQADATFLDFAKIKEPEPNDDHHSDDDAYSFNSSSDEGEGEASTDENGGAGPFKYFISFSKKCFDILSEYDCNYHSAEPDCPKPLETFSKNFKKEHGPLQGTEMLIYRTNISKDMQELKRPVHQYIMSISYKRRRTMHLASRMTEAVTESVAHYRTSLETSTESNAEDIKLKATEVQIRIEIHLYHVYGLLYWDKASEKFEQPLEERSNQQGGRKDCLFKHGLVKKLTENHRVLQLLLLLSAKKSEDKSEDPHRYHYFQEPENCDDIFPSNGRIVPLCSHMNTLGRSCFCSASITWLTKKNEKYKKPLNEVKKIANIQDKVTKTAKEAREVQRFLATVKLLHSILEAAHKYFNGESLFKLAPYLNMNGVHCSMSRPDSTDLSETNYGREVNSNEQVDKEKKQQI
mmetsp:Transcript_13577/g.26189  ORF Transcript_13577/g.26189 Transcript_13577/m.26189 type:complete len:417 (-) Transcript_13577:44-1294(-)